MQVSTPDASTALAAIGQHLPDAPTAGDVARFAALVLAIEAEVGPMHVSTCMHLAHKIAGRSAVIPKDVILVGLPHKLGGIAVCVGDITVWSEGKRERFTGAHIITTRPGGYRIGLAHADTTWLTVHANETGGEDIAAIEDSLVDGADRLMTRRVALLQGAMQ